MPNRNIVSGRVQQPELMSERRYARRCSSLVLVCFGLALGLAQIAAHAESASVEELKRRITQASSALRDISMTFTAIEKNRDALDKIDPNYAAMYALKAAKLYLKQPDKLRTEGKLGMVRFEYIINGGLKIVRAPALKVNRRSDYSGDPGKLSDALDFGLVTPSLWASRTIEVIEDKEAEGRGEIKLRLRWTKSTMSILIWIDSKEMYLKRVERRDGDGRLKVALVYSAHRKPDGIIWVPTRIEMRASDGDKVGVSEMTDIKVNTGLPDSLFQ